MSAEETREEFEDALEELSSAEDFFVFFGVDFEPSVVHVNRLHILQRYHDYLAKAENLLPDDLAARRASHRALLERAYRDFVHSDAQTEKVFAVFRQQGEPGFVGLEAVAGAEPAPDAGADPAGKSQS